MTQSFKDGAPTASLLRPTRRKLLTSGAALAGGAAISSFPYISRARAANEPLKFWQFYAPGGQEPGQVKWFTDMVASWNAQNDVKVELDYVPNADYMDGTPEAVRTTNAAHAHATARLRSSRRPRQARLISCAG